MKKLVLALVLLALVVGVSYTQSAFLDSGKHVGSTFSVGNADIKLVNDLTLGTDEANLVDTKDGPIFSNIYPGWVKEFETLIYNDGSLKMAVDLASEYSTALDPSSLREYINLDVYSWDDINQNGVYDSGDTTALSYGKKNIIKWKSEGATLGEIYPGEVKGYLFRFSADSLPTTKQGVQGVFDFEFNGTTEGVTQN